MKRYEVLKSLLNLVDADQDAVVFANGRTVREALYLNDRPNHFYMLSSMGHAPMIGLGVAMAQPERKTIVVDADGNVLMNLGGLVHVGSAEPQNFLHVCLDNQVYGTTGSQRCLSADVDLSELAKASGYKTVQRITTNLADVEAAFQKLYTQPGPSFLHIHIDADDLPDCPVFDLPPETIKSRFKSFLSQ